MMMSYLESPVISGGIFMASRFLTVSEESLVKEGHGR